MSKNTIPRARTIPAEVAAGLHDATLRGSATLRFFGMPVYDARLWTQAAFTAERYEHWPFALEIQYARKFAGAAIAERSLAEMRRVGNFGADESQRWMALMERAFPDVQCQDRLTGLHLGHGKLHFYCNGLETAATTDPEFVRLFFGVWLAPKTQALALRAALIGHAEEKHVS